VAGAPGTGLTVEVGNPPAGTAATSPPGTQISAGQGLAGLTERVALAAGRIEYGPTSAGGFRLCAWLPWPTPT
jgi:signal transduction histidine kinase